MLARADRLIAEGAPAARDRVSSLGAGTFVPETMPHGEHPTILCIAIQYADLLTGVFENKAESTHKHHSFLWGGSCLEDRGI